MYSGCNHTRDEQNWITAKRESNLLIMSMITDRIGRQEVLLPINHHCYNFHSGTQAASTVRLKVYRMINENKAAKLHQSHLRKLLQL